MADSSSPGDPECLRDTTSCISDLGRRVGFSDGRIGEILTAFHEAVSNATKHGNEGNSARGIHPAARLEGESLIIEIADEGSGLVAIPPLPDLSQKIKGKDRPAGWGLFLLRSFASEVTFHAKPHGGHSVRMRFDREAPSSPIEPKIVREADDR
jgi:anti-sigma regulatory factor (Ser/Thr protein kinase)